MAGSLHLTLPCHHLLYTSGPAWRRTRSSIQSVPGQPDAAADSTPRHHGDAALALFAVMRVWSASHVAGAPDERSIVFGSYQIRPLTDVLMKTPISLPLTVPRSTSGAAVSDL